MRTVVEEPLEAKEPALIELVGENGRRNGYGEAYESHKKDGYSLSYMHLVQIGAKGGLDVAEEDKVQNVESVAVLSQSTKGSKAEEAARRRRGERQREESGISEVKDRVAGRNSSEGRLGVGDRL